MIRSFRDLTVYQKAYGLSLEIHKLSLRFPKFEQFELASQIRRSSKSIATNIAEGFGKNASLPEFKRFLKIALGSCDEVRVQLDYCRDLAYITIEQYNLYEGICREIVKMIVSMLKNWKNFKP